MGEFALKLWAIVSVFKKCKKNVFVIFLTIKIFFTSDKQIYTWTI